MLDHGLQFFHTIDLGESFVYVCHMSQTQAILGYLLRNVNHLKFYCFSRKPGEEFPFTKKIKNSSHSMESKSMKYKKTDESFLQKC